MLVTRKPTSQGRRHQISVVRTDLHKGKPEKALVASGHLKRQGRGFKGHITVRHRGGGVKKQLRVIDWKRSKFGIPAVVKRIEYDPVRSANIALLYYADGSKAYIIAPENLTVGTEVKSGPGVEVRVGNTLPLSEIPVGLAIHNLELTPGKGAQLVRGAGVGALIQSKEGNTVTIQLPSKELRLINSTCLATIGQVGNSDWKNRKIGKAGRTRLMGIRPTVRGTAQHPGSHPHGGGEGRSGIGLKHPKTPWGKPALGKKTRNRKKWSTRLIVADRRKK
ncbi:MAG: 50S ribosomal protein L2 [Candidatus Pacebacteria bacterium CG_4_10_14_0_8_um_filter_43_12]|nr:MAG: 50S ribosomal protein L2 [Candidatus Pacebacteria bacterium CG10_big_fil_rev_8_21_14_0_10_44_11]PIY79555.1 MAG: 50S ribosomal protein L2 [Candidatus Pacebacteria bacterium CG_4_10_14_0_8_um_filter_43_12]